MSPPFPTLSRGAGKVLLGPEGVKPAPFPPSLVSGTLGSPPPLPCVRGQEDFPAAPPARAAKPGSGSGKAAAARLGRAAAVTSASPVPLPASPEQCLFVGLGRLWGGAL